MSAGDQPSPDFGRKHLVLVIDKVDMEAYANELNVFAAINHLGLGGIQLLVRHKTGNHLSTTA